ncbi:translation elongation factor 4 [Novipirellula artificiosorum]|uniref:Elongation factor 4 n=1 Tax=Novipirellula artificiosorum TaxID=2528016 RepID=A0A5C6E1X0_9BACT|nr:translation elongation factor 4 [Novipirellula artificiosorum]TWU42848.1 Elongation factor 4 [Novipirellula artificiosorum]
MSSNIRNFCIIAHIDHGKSTLADRLLEHTGTVSNRDMKEQLLDDLELERSRGITIKARAVTMRFKRNGTDYELNLIDTPGHVDFHYEVSRSLACCEGVLLLVDAFQGVEAQTVANAFAAMEHNLKIIPVINKIDLTHARPEEVAEEMMNSLGTDPDECVRVSAKTGQGVDELIDCIIEHIPTPTGDPAATLQAMVFDSNYDDFRGAITYVRIMNGTVCKGQKIRFLKAGSVHEVVELGRFAPQRQPCDQLKAGQVGYLICNIKSLGDVHIGDTISIPGDKHAPALPGYSRPKRMVYCGLFPSDGQDFTELRDALERLSINDPSFEFEPETSEALGFGFRCGFLGLLHMEIIQQRLENESDIDLVQTAPNVTYEIINKRGETISIHKPQDVPDPGDIEEFRQPIVRCNIIVPNDYIGAVMKLCQERRGIQQTQEYLGAQRAMLGYNIPLAEVVYDLHDKIKSCTRGYGTLDYEMVGFEPADLCRLDIVVNGSRVDALSIVCHRADADRRGRAVVKRLKLEIERHMFEVAVQAAVGSRVIARETVPAMRKNVTAKCYGGDITRKRKLLQKQKEGKKRMKAIGNVEISQKAFMAVLSDSEG